MLGKGHAGMELEKGSMRTHIMFRKGKDDHMWYMILCSINTENLRRTMLFCP